MERWEVKMRLANIDTALGLGMINEQRAMEMRTNILREVYGPQLYIVEEGTDE